MEQPLVFLKFFQNIQKIKNGLRIICCAPLFEKFMQAIFQTKKKSSLFFIRRRYATPSRQGFQWKYFPLENKLHPSSPPLCGRASPQGEAFEIGKN